MEKKEKKVDKEQAKKSDDDDDYEWSEPLHQDSANGGAKANETNGAADGAADGAANGSRVDFAGRLIDATGNLNLYQMIYLSRFHMTRCTRIILANISQQATQNKM
jgi:hypothetical protein